MRPSNTSHFACSDNELRHGMLHARPRFPFVFRGLRWGMTRGMRPLLAAVVALLLVQGAHGQQQPAQQQPPTADPNQPPIFRTGINFVRVDVIISDKTGNPVADLQQSDFDVTEDGKPQKIETFKLIKLDGGRGDSAKEPPREIRTDYDEEEEAARDDVRLFAVFLDDYHVRRGS